MKKKFIPLLFLCLLTGCSRPASSEHQISQTDFCLDTVVTLTLNGTEDESLLQSCFDQIRSYEALFSRTAQNSDIWTINHSDASAVEVHPETASLLNLALDFSRLTDGAFDMTVAPVMDLWDFTGSAPHALPDPDALQESLQHVDYQTVSIEDNLVTLADPDAALDLGGIAKGYIADCLGTFLKENGIDSAMLDLGGNILVIGGKPDGSNWRIGIRRPFGESSDVIAVVPASDQSIVTSGTYERFFELDGQLYHHLIDPKTGYPVQNGLLSVTILANSSARADALSTSCFVLGLECGMELIESLDDTEALFITEDMELHRSSGFPE